MKKGFLLVECLIAAALAAVFLPLLASAFTENLHAAVELRRCQEAWRGALSCVEEVEAWGKVPSPEKLLENFSSGFASFDVSVDLSPSAEGSVCTVLVTWPGRGETREVRLSRRIR
ncbi:MAG: hypothetical protein SOV63_10430 [Pyramidobacter porci]|uniref:type IV pilus modification PilV family protein n=1 Tax=Pyramidobacter porci TaxID=2605789 RepID=UPI002A74B175|nr:hypothetical protein [Pyramidobacter porci]MDY2649206.1 hypothetical protein [Pyramidobacter porci]